MKISSVKVKQKIDKFLCLTFFFQLAPGGYSIHRGPNNNGLRHFNQIGRFPVQAPLIGALLDLDVKPCYKGPGGLLS